jgi:DNA-binding transcriptional LysR family regulator
METRHLQMFLAVVELGSLGRAARHLGLSQPALTQAIGRLEHTFKVKLFERSPRGMLPTRYGEALATRARSIAQEARSAVEDIEALRGGERGHVVVGAGPSLSASLVPDALHRLLRIKPKLTVRLLEGMSDQLFPALMRGDIDLAVTTAVDSQWEKDLTSEQILNDSVVIVARHAHPIGKLLAPTLRDTLDFPWVMPPPGEAFRVRTEALFVAARLPVPPAAVETSSGGAIKALVAQGNYLSIVPRELFKQEEERGVLRSILVAGGSMHRAVHAVYRQRTTLSAGARSFIAQLHRIAREQRRAAALSS